MVDFVTPGGAPSVNLERNCDCPVYSYEVPAVVDWLY